MMGPVLSIYKKDIKAFLTTPMFYMLVGLCCLLWAIFFGFDVYAFVQKSYQISLQSQVGDLNLHQHLIAPYLIVVHYVLIFVIAALSMRFFTEEKKMRTLPILLTSPISSGQIVLAKWLTGASVILVLLMISAILPLSLAFFASLSWTLLIWAYVGLFFLLCIYMSGALLVSSMTESSIVCVILTLVVSLFFVMLGAGGQMTSVSWVQEVFQFLSFDQHFNHFRLGVFNGSSFVYFFSWSLLMAVMTERIVEFHRWR